MRLTRRRSKQHGPRVAVAACLPALGLILLAATLVGGVATGCGSGEVTIVFHAPTVAELSPLGQSIAQVVLTRLAPGEPAERIVREITNPDRGVDFGSIDPGKSVQLAVELRSPTQRLVGYGRSAVLDIGPGDRVEVPIHVRRPFVYTAGDDMAITTMDATGDTTGMLPATSYLGSIDVLSGPLALATSPDGTHIVAIASDGTLAMLLTSDHLTVDGGTIALGKRPSDVAMSPDGQFVVVGHRDDTANGGPPGGVSIVDLSAPPASAVLFKQLGNVTRVVMAPPAPGGGANALAYALMDGGDAGQDCNAQVTSSIAGLPLVDPPETITMVSAGGLVSDIAVQGDGQLVAALPCTGEIRHMSADGTPGDVLTMVSRVSALAARPDRLWSVGTLPADETHGARLILIAVDASGEELAHIELPALQERVLTTEFSGPGEEASRQIDADDMAVLDLVSLPGDAYVAVLTSGVFRASSVFPTLPSLDLRNREYLLIDTATTAIVQRVRTLCDLQVGIGDVQGWRCTLSTGQAETGRAFRPLGMTALYGTR